ncbi:hypothetical protein J6590_007483 [Homalodisca vitripennis]|nr:hypothetical protein J6590_007483 [Homalodisca vitripennis]
MTDDGLTACFSGTVVPFSREGIVNRSIADSSRSVRTIDMLSLSVSMNTKLFRKIHWMYQPQISFHQFINNSIYKLILDCLDRTSGIVVTFTQEGIVNRSISDSFRSVRTIDRLTLSASMNTKLE